MCNIRIPVLIFLLLLPACSPEPDFFTSHHTAIVTNNIESITPELMESALDFFVIQLPLLSRQRYTEKQLKSMLQYTWMEWYPEPIELNGKLYAGLQQGYIIRVHWKGSIQDSAFFHELMHEIQEHQDGIYDHKHEESKWWKLEGELNALFVNWNH